MRATLQKHPLKLKSFIIAILFGILMTSSQIASAEVINIPIKRTIATQPITSLEIIAIVKSLLNGRVLSIQKQSSYSNPDCHMVKLLEDKGEFQIIKLGCFVENIVQASE